MILTLAGPYPKEVPGLIRELLPPDLALREIKDQESLDAARDLEIVILRTLRMGGALIEANPGLRLIQRWGAGYDTVDIEAAGRRKVPVAVAAGVNSNAVAEHALLLILACLRHLTALDASMKRGLWDRTKFAQNSYTIADKTLGLLGCGAIGRLVAEKARALGARVKYFDAFRLSEREEKALGIEYASFDEVVSSSDIITLHLPLLEGTKNIMDQAALAAMKPGSVLVNTSRGGLVDEAALAKALVEGPLMAAALDSFSEEPYPADGPLMGLENLIMTPHMGGSVVDLTLPMVRKVAANALAVMNGRPLPRRDMVNQAACGYPAE
ncbi:MAG: Phosphoglycerate dehydrogenase and related dehydrogenase [Spirochaetes bacterium]|nr:MAG: Phosphoglycerate dehydrogenase and related dehydrogenase [Spirochaetota bacterium]